MELPCKLGHRTPYWRNCRRQYRIFKAKQTQRKYRTRIRKAHPKVLYLLTLFLIASRYVDNECIKVESEGGAPMITELLKEKWDHIFFTGSVSVGKVVYEAAGNYQV